MEGGGGQSGGGVGLGVGQGGCERRIAVFVKIKKKNICFFFWGGGVRLLGGGVRVDVNEELKFLGKVAGLGLVGGQSGCERNVGGKG